MKVNNIYENIPGNIQDELFENIVDKEGLTIERIISEAHASPPGFWYDQDKNEFVILLDGSAQLSFKDSKSLILKPGDYINIPAHLKHRVDWTDDTCKTIWIAVHY